MAAARGALVEGGAALIQPLRRAHLRIWIVLAVALYGVAIAGLLARRTTTPANSNLRWEQYR